MKTLQLIALLSAFPLAANAQSPKPDTIYLHGNILTGAHLRASDTSTIPTRVTAIAVANGRIVAVGSDAELLKLKSASTKVVDLNGAFAMPGFNDAHTHIAGAGQQHLTVDLIGAASLTEMQARIRAYVADSGGLRDAIELDQGRRLGPHALARKEAALEGRPRLCDRLAPGGLRAR